ncbi:PfkB family carbohydrate kinase [Planktomarina temperata]|nr:PfkB family carbohydrate kinase [Planktomarina temperata]
MTEKKIIVIGDFILDFFYLGNVQRVSPEAPNLILDVESVSMSMGGAYNVAAHCRSLGLRTSFHSVCGSKNCSIISPKLEFDPHDNIISDPNRPMTTKSRFIADYKYQTLLRVDEEKRTQISQDHTDQILQSIENITDEFSTICVVDYNKGVVTERLMKGIQAISDEQNIKVIVDTKRASLEIFKKAYIVKPNRREFEISKEEYGFKKSSNEAFTSYLFETLGIQNVIVTKGNDGIDLYSNGILTATFEGNATAPLELSGAGDSVCASIAYAVAINMKLEYGVKMANQAASVFVTQPASYRIQLKDLEC